MRRLVSRCFKAAAIARMQLGLALASAPRCSQPCGCSADISVMVQAIQFNSMRGLIQCSAVGDGAMYPVHGWCAGHVLDKDDVTFVCPNA